MLKLSAEEHNEKRIIINRVNVKKTAAFHLTFITKQG